MKDDTFYISGKISIPCETITTIFDCGTGETEQEYEVELEKVYIEKVIYNNPVTVVVWSDNTKTVSKCHGDDMYSKETGLAVCIMKKLVGTTETRNIFMDWIPEDNKPVVRLSDVRKKIKERNR